MRTCSPRAWLSIEFTVTVCTAFLTLGTIGCAHHVSQPPTQAQPPTTTEASTQVPLRPDCGGMNQPPCKEPTCGTLGDDCCKGTAACRGGLVCKNGTCVSKNSCGGIGEACCAHLNPVCSTYLLKCIDGICAGGKQVSDLSVTLRTNDEDKDDDTGIRIAIDGLATWSQTDNTHYDNWSTHTWSLNPNVVRLDDLAGRYVSICMMPNGDDTWKFNFLLQGTRDDGVPYEVRKENVFLSTDVPCLSWDATPVPAPKGEIIANGKCLTVTKGGTVGSTVVLNDCVGGAGQEWNLVPQISTPAPDGARVGQIRHLVQCLGLPASGRFPELQTCNNSPGQQWKWFGGAAAQVTGNLVKCLDPNSQQSQGSLQYVSCDGTLLQRWTMPVCGGTGKACCDSGIPCEGALSCKKGTCSAGSNVNDLSVTLQTTNEDKDDDTHVSMSGLFSWPGDGKTKYDNWSTRRIAMAPSSKPLAIIPISSLTVLTQPNGEDSWKLNFMIDGVRDDGIHYEFRRDNIWLTNEDVSRTAGMFIKWQLGPPPLDVIWKDTDENGLPLNPFWREFQEQGPCENNACAEQACPYHPSPLQSDSQCIPFTHKCTGETPNDYGRCSSQAPTYDRSAICGWHANWFPATVDGTIAQGGGKNPPQPRGDDDFHVDLVPRNRAANFARTSITAEFDSDETTDQFLSNWWNGFDDDEHVAALKERDARMIGLFGIDTEHGPHAELHPVYVFMVRAGSGKVLGGGGAILDTWGIFVRNWGNEGECGGSQHYLDEQEFTLRFSAPKGAEVATSVKEAIQTNFDAGTMNGDWSIFKISGFSPIQHDADGTFVEKTFSIGPPDQQTFIDGSLSIQWMCGSDFCPTPPSTPAPPSAPPVTTPTEDADQLPGANLLTKAQLDELEKQWPSHRRKPTRPSQPIQSVPFTATTPPAYNVGQGSLTDRTVPDPGRQQRMVDIQKNICKLLGNDSKRPEICNSIQ